MQTYAKLTLTEAMIIIAILCVVATVFWRSYKTNKVTCIGGYQFVVDYGLRNTQVIDNQGHGIPCK